MGSSLMWGYRSNILFTIVPIIVVMGFVLVFAIILIRSMQGAKQWNRNNHSPVLTVDATIVAKRADVQHYSHNSGTHNIHHSSSTTYFVTFEVESGDRMEFNINNSEYGMLVERDKGKLTFQGTRYLGFERTR